MAIFGSVTGFLYCLGRINVVTPGTPVGLNQNVSNTTAFGTAANPPSMRFNELTFKAPGGTGGSGGNQANTGNIYICYKGGNRTIQNSIICDLQPGQGYVLSSAAFNSPLDPTMFVVDADTGGDGCRVSGLVA